MDAFLQSIEADAASTFETNTEEWQAARQVGAVAGQVAVYSDSAADCDAALHSGAGQVASPTAPLLVSVAEQYKDSPSAASAYSQLPVWGLSSSDMKKAAAEGTVEGSSSGLGTNSISWAGSFFGAPFYIAFWQNKDLVLFMLASNIDSDLSKKASTAENGRIGHLSVASVPASAPSASSAVAQPSRITCSLTSDSHPRVIAIASGTNSLALKSDGSVWAWGRGDKGQLGDGAFIDSNTPVRVGNLNCVTAIAAGSNHDLALRTDGSVWAWGGNTRGQLGDGPAANADKPVAVMGLGSGVVAIAAGDETSFALKSDGSVWAWGRSDRGQLGDGNTSDSAIPVPVSGLSTGVAAIAAGDDFSLVLKTDGSVWGWGNSFSGQLGTITDQPLLIPTAVHGLAPGVKAISAGEGHSLVLKADGSVWALGKNTSGELGNGTTRDASVPTRVVGFASGAIAVASGTDDDSLALKSDGSVWAWGWGAACQLGNGSSDDRHLATPVTGLRSGVTAIAAGSGGGLALKSDGSLWAWGTNNHGELGDGVTQPEGGSCVPVQVVGLG